ncbi:hypothetical protein K2173_024338 [Erythroxylum novogranatense]|uniref:Neprosin PEP catalytic domain-containing protein n=1 Tax=Erythroxylum novogranatense TaxID=1862640 RepID=A0AAV8SV38_9ROSI|nr:hypothetical protein K2173_024338 [Erythroxylum novogranatense]
MVGLGHGSCIFFFIILIQVWSFGLADRSSISAKKSLQIDDDGDVIDCVDIYKQPALNHPLLKNHTIQMKPSSLPRGMEATNSTKTFQSRFKNINCPEGTIPILRTKAFNHGPVTPAIPKRIQSKEIIDFTPAANHEFAQAFVYGERYYGARASFNVWAPNVADPGEFSIAEMWVISGDKEKLNSIEAGWQVLTGRNETRFFIYWTRDGYQTTGCYNLECPGFVQVSSRHALGGPLQPVSTYGGDQYEIDVFIYLDKFSGYWWLMLQKELIGYWPGNILTTLAYSSDLITFGGQIINNQYEGHHTTTQMGSGHFSGEGLGKAAYIGHLSYVDASNVLKDAGLLVPDATKPACYDINVSKVEPSNDLGVHVYFGGPGFSNQCP